MMLTKLFAILALLLVSTIVMAAFDGPGAEVKIRTVTEANQAKDDERVILEGYLVQKLEDEEYLFKDLTGEIEVEIDDDIFQDRYVNPSTQIRIHGEIDKGFFSGRTIDVERLEIIN